MKRLKYFSIVLNTILLSLVSVLGLTTVTLAHKNHNRSNSEPKIEQQSSTINQDVAKEEVPTDEPKHEQILENQNNHKTLINSSVESKAEVAHNSIFNVKNLIPQPAELLLVLIIINPFLLHFLKKKISSS